MKLLVPLEIVPPDEIDNVPPAVISKVPLLYKFVVVNVSFVPNVIDFPEFIVNDIGALLTLEFTVME
jgi:hypothetical protein